MALLALLVGCGDKENAFLDDRGCDGCREDQGWLSVDCPEAEAGLAFLEAPASRFDMGFASAVYGQLYASNPPHLPGELWEPATEAAPYCDEHYEAAQGEQQANRAFHLARGPLEESGLIGMRLTDLVGGDCDDDPALPYCASSSFSPYDEYTVDLSHADGVSFWARRAPSGQQGLRIALTDINSDHDTAYIAQYHQLTGSSEQAQPLCERVRECGCSADAPETCGQTSCDQNYAPFDGQLAYEIGRDPQFNGKPCSPFGAESYCFNPDVDPPPAPQSERCGNYWELPVELSTEWRFTKVPFDKLKQRGAGKRSPHLDLAHLVNLTFRWGPGYIDFWLDDVRFYTEGS